MAFLNETCGGCGIRRLQHPIVVVMHAEDAKAIEAVPISGENAHGFVQVPVCAACHQDPAHRTFPLKGHFFARERADRGHSQASRNLDGGGVGGA